MSTGSEANLKASETKGPFGGDLECDPDWHGNDLGQMIYTEGHCQPLAWVVCAYCRMPFDVQVPA